MPDNAPPDNAPPETAPHETAPHDTDGTSVLHDRAAIVETCTRSAWSTDRRDWPAFREVFADEVDLDYTSLNGGEPLHLPRQSIVDGWRTVLSGLDATQHLVGNHLVTVDGDTAECTASVLATHILANDRGEPIWTVGGHYRYRLARTHEGWRISGLRLTVDWTSGNRDIMLLAVQDQPEHVREWKHENGRA